MRRRHVISADCPGVAGRAGLGGDTSLGAMPLPVSALDLVMSAEIILLAPEWDGSRQHSTASRSRSGSWPREALLQGRRRVFDRDIVESPVFSPFTVGSVPSSAH